MRNGAAEQARAKLILFYGIKEPTERQAALFALYGEDAPFLSKGQTQIANHYYDGGICMKDLMQILINLRGAKQLLTLLCNETMEIKVPALNGNAQESLYLIEDALEKSIRDLEALINK